MLKEFRTILPLMKKFISWYAAGLFFLTLTDAGQLFIPQIIRSIVDTLSEGVYEMNDIAARVGILLLVALCIALGRFGWRIFIHGASRRIEYMLRDTLFKHLLSLSSSFYRKYKTGDIMARFTNDMRSIRMATGMAIVAFVDGVFMMLAILVILFSRYPDIAWIVILPLPIVTVTVIGAGRFLGERFRRVQEGFSRISDFVQESLSGIRVIKSFAREKEYLRSLEVINNDYRDRNMQLVRIWGFLFPLVSFLSGLATLLLLYFGGRRVMTGLLSPGDFAALISYLQMLIWPMMGAGFTVNMLQRGAASLGRINAFLREEPDIRNPENPVREIPAGGIQVRNLNYTYPESGRWALKDVSFDIPPGTSLGILGRVGSGKSTLIRLLPRMLEPQEGALLIGGRDIREYDLRRLRSAFGIVPQKSFLFSISIRENIAFGSEGGEEDLLRYADMSTISRDFSQFSTGWDTQVGEKGVALSGGQKQRLAISRALASEPNILVFDDALSAVDTDTEEKILKAFMAERSGKTMIIVSNRVSSLQWTDNIIVLDDGRIIQEGTPEELADREGFFRDILELQRLSGEKGER